MTPSSSAVTNNFKISALVTIGAATGYTDNVVRVVPAVEGRFHRWGKYSEYDNWLEHARLAGPAGSSAPRRCRRSAWARRSRSRSTSTTGRRRARAARVTLTLPAGFTADATSKPYGPLAAGADTQVVFTLTNTDATLPGAATNDPGTTTLQKTIGIATSYSTPASSASENLTMTVVPVTTIPVAASAPVMDGQEDAGVYTGPALDLSRKWSGGACSPAGTDCGTAGAVGDATSSYAAGRGQQRHAVLLHPRP